MTEQVNKVWATFVWSIQKYAWFSISCRISSCDFITQKTYCGKTGLEIIWTWIWTLWIRNWVQQNKKSALLTITVGWDDGWVPNIYQGVLLTLGRDLWFKVQIWPRNNLNLNLYSSATKQEICISYNLLQHVCTEPSNKTDDIVVNQ